MDQLKNLIDFFLFIFQYKRSIDEINVDCVFPYIGWKEDKCFSNESVNLLYWCIQLYERPGILQRY